VTYDELISHYGNEPKAGVAIGVPRQTVHRWKGRVIPLDQQVLYEVASSGVLRADLPDSLREARAAA